MPKMSKIPHGSMQSEFQRDFYAPPQPPNYMERPPSYTPAPHMAPKPTNQPVPSAPFPPPPVLIQYIQQQNTYFGRDPTPTVCTHCRKNVITQIRPISGKITYTTAAIGCILCGLICCLLPFCIDSLQDVEHFCPECGVSLGRYKRW